ncbi:MULTISPECIES: hypothetical protein [Agrobacterium]|uniref:Uncharacterized protein n=1 Tax=Agrobacterium larrymoorei TaxID=160699 RepID=A0ABX8TC61_9HYPH|nr:hypothetical protein [Agrobacterium larrymoorei]NSZ10111.1 hypothetical protein [Agrobacterium tumefaciens]QYA10826.1 hypothetical protein J5285_26090 [Agrobacterium larrymoorei]
MQISKRVLEWVTSAATLGGVILGFDAMAQAAAKKEGLIIAIVGLFVSFVSGMKLYSDFLDWVGPDPEKHKFQRGCAGVTAVVLFGALAFTISLFQAKGMPAPPVIG